MSTTPKPVTVTSVNPTAVPVPKASIIKSDEKRSEDIPGVFEWGNMDMMQTLTRFLLEGTSILVKLNPVDFEMFGKMSSHEYRKMFFKVTANLPNEAKIWIIILFTAIKSRPRVLSAMVKFNEESWYRPTREFIMQKMVQYTGELPVDQSKFAAVHIPHIMPSFTSICWLKMTIPKERTVEKFLANLWACQMKMPESLMLRQKAWEVNFWNHTVKKSKNAVRDNANVKLEFHEDFWVTKSMDKYPFLNQDGNEVLINNEEDLLSWINMWSAFVKST